MSAGMGVIADRTIQLSNKVYRILITGTMTRPFDGAVAQLVERLLCKQNVRSSNLLSSTIMGYDYQECYFKVGLVAQLVRAHA